MKSLTIAILTLALAVPAAPVQAGQSVSLILNWTPAADHSPIYYAKSQGWYEKAGIDLSIEVGKGSAVSALKVGSGAAPFGISDLATMLVARSKGADDVALMSIYANTGRTFYWLKSSGVSGSKDFAGRKIGNPPGDASRVMWPAFAKATGLAPELGVLCQYRADREIGGAQEPCGRHHQRFLQFARHQAQGVRQRIGFAELEGDRAQLLRQFDHRQRRISEKNPKLAEDFVRITQKAYAACVADFEPCLKVLLEQVSGLDREEQLMQWRRIKELMTDEFTTTKGLGWIDGERMKKDYDLVQTYLGIEKPFAVETVFTTRLLDPTVKMDASKVGP